MRPVLRFGSLALLSLSALTAGCQNESSFRGRAIPPVAVVSGDQSGPASDLFQFEISGRDSYDPNALEQNGIYEWNWSIYSTPTGANATIDSQGRDVTFTTDKPGRHVVQLIVRDINDFAYSEPTLFEIRAFPITGFAVSLTWRTAVNDVDLHVIEDTMMGGGSLFDEELDCHFANLAPDWLPEGSPDGDPRLNHDNVDGYGPETTELPVPTVGERYHVMVHYFSDDGFADTDATIKVWVNGIQEMELERNLLANDLWDVVVLDWSGATGVVSSIDSVSTY